MNGRCTARLLAIAVVVIGTPPRDLAGQVRITDWGLVAATSVKTGGPASTVRTTSFRSLEVVATLRGPETSWLRMDFPLGFIVAARLGNTALGPATGFGLGSTREWRVGDAVRTTARAFGIRPFGVRLAAGPDGLLVHTGAAVGGLHFNIPAPASNASRFNFTVEVEAGVRVRIPHGRFAVGYRLHHLSNGGFGRVNPGVDSHMVYFGVVFS